jgi:BirA family biotin operon repressor/biotin-[acetyl-CoA-carboxylase] ligase
MHIIKLDTINSTNDFLKQYAIEKLPQNFTVVVAKNQTKGRGQMGETWQSEYGKNLTFSVLVRDLLIARPDVFILNKAVALAVLYTLEKFKISNLAIKWPNDILSENKKLVGILIENTFKTNENIQSIIGIGINVNQTVFVHLPQATSMAIIKAKTFDLDEVLNVFLNELSAVVNLIKFDQIQLIKEKYDKYLFHKDKLSVFEDKHNQRFMGIIRQVNDDGQIIIEKENEIFEAYGFKEVKTLLNFGRPF